MSKPKLEDILCVLNIVVLQKLDDGSFKLIGDAPEWFMSNDRESVKRKKKISPADYYPFLESFFVDAEWFWEKQPTNSNRFRSATWTETDSEGNEFHMEASAAVIKSNKILLIERLGEAYEEKALIIQQAREKILELERLSRSHEQVTEDVERVRDLYDTIKEELFRDIVR